MSLIGKTLGNFGITTEIGRGGMGEVYQARDRKLGRDVAVKVLPEEFAKDADRVARFQLEAKLLASLNHPNIAAIYGLEESGGTNFLVLELVEGETLADQIKRGPIPVEESLKLALQIAEALEAAHEKGVIHRDLKPANIKVTPDSKVKVLDFGLAKAFAGEQAELNLSNSPTLSNAATQQGVILGTAAYMSPEQARGRAVDKRADIWAFGCVLFEMLTGRQAWTGDTVTDIIAAALTRDPDFNSLPPNIHKDIRKLLSRCLQKDPNKRLRDAADAAMEIEEALAAPPVAETFLAVPSPRRWLREITLVVIVLVIGCALGLGIGIWKLQTPGGTSAVARLTVVLPPETELFHEIDMGPLNFAVSPEGSRIAFVARHSGSIAQLYLRSLDSLDAQAVPGSENAFQPFFSPDGKWVAYWANNVLFKVSVEGPVPVKIGSATFPLRGAAWGANNTIFLGGANRGLYRIPADGGEALEITHPNINQGEQYHAWPDVLPDGKHVLFTSVRADGYDIGALSLETGEWHILERTEEAGQPHYVNSGHLVFFRGGGLFAAPFDLSKIGFSGPASPVLENVSWGFFAGLNLGHFSVSRSGSLLFLPATGTEEQSRLVLVDRAGKERGLSTPTGRYFAKPSFSPDGKQVAADYSIRKSVDVWVFDLERGTRTRLTTEGDNIFPTWSADGTRIIYAAFKRGSGSFDLYWTRADGSGKPEALLVKDYDQVPNAVSRDGRWIAFQESNIKTGDDICFLNLENRSVVPFLATPANEAAPDFSPDSRFLAYASDESGRFEVYVRSISGAEGKIAVSSEGGNSPRWSHKGDALFYRSGDKIMAVKISTSPKFSTGKPQPLFQGAYGTYFDVTPDGRHFLMLKPSKQPPVTQIQVVLNWLEELKQRVPVK